MKFFIFFLILVIKSCSAATYNNAKLIFIGSSYSDYKSMTVASNFASVVGTKYFNMNKLTVFIIHGWTANYAAPLASTLINAFLTRPEYNIIFADWGCYADNLPEAAAAAIPGVAQAYVQFMLQMKTAGYDLTKMYPIGHSMGALLAGNIGYLLLAQNNTLLPRITGLDPAGADPIRPFTALVKGNAKFVDIIHTYTPISSIGNLDFWPNGGGTQPLCIGCSTIFSLNVISCNICAHVASWVYYAESVRSLTSNFKALWCPTSTYSRTACTGPETASMGFHASSSSKPGNYYLATRAFPPYSF